MNKKTLIKESSKDIESVLTQLPQVECPVHHHFGPGVYIRECHFPKDTVVIGHHHNFENLNIMLSGKILLIEAGETKELTAPTIFTAEPGRKIGYALTDVVWQNIHATEETDLEKIESHFIDKSKKIEDLEKQLKILKESNKISLGGT